MDEAPPAEASKAIWIKVVPPATAAQIQQCAQIAGHQVFSSPPTPEHRAPPKGKAPAPRAARAGGPRQGCEGMRGPAPSKRAPSPAFHATVRLEGRWATCTLGPVPQFLGRAARGSVAPRKFACGRDGLFGNPYKANGTRTKLRRASGTISLTGLLWNSTRPPGGYLSGIHRPPLKADKAPLGDKGYACFLAP